MNDLIPTNGGNSLENHKTSTSLVARGLSSLIDATQKDLDFEMGHNYWEGKNGYEQSEELALECFKKSAAKNNFEAMCDLALLLSWHLACGCLRDDSHTCGMNESAQLDAWESRTKESVGWLHKAALAGHARAQYELPGSWCYCDDDTECDNIVSCFRDKLGWLNKSAAQNYPPAVFELGLRAKNEVDAAFYFDRFEGFESNEHMSPHLSPPRLLSLATFHLQGKWPHDSGHKCASEFKPNLSKGLVLHTRLAKQGCNQSRVALAEYYFTNESTSNYAEMSFYWSRIAAESGHILWLARCYENGVGTTINLEEAIAMYQKPYAGRELSKAATKKIDHLRQRITK